MSRVRHVRQSSPGFEFWVSADSSLARQFPATVRSFNVHSMSFVLFLKMRSPVFQKTLLFFMSSYNRYIHNNYVNI